jgi:hypothetical protein
VCREILFWIGLKNNWQGNHGFNTVAFPLNYVATPINSTLSMVLATAGMVENGFQGDSSFFAGTLIFSHRLCPGYSRLDRQFHEVGHAVQNSIMGDPGIIAVAGLLWANSPWAETYVFGRSFAVGLEIKREVLVRGTSL